jgi:nitrite reductase/ring-hydroxylating ferredoxin subunit
MRKIFILLALFSFLTSCEKHSDLLPDIAVDEWVYLNNPSNIALQSPGGWTYINGGLKGIIIYRYSDKEFKAYERSCPHLSPSQCSKAEVVENILVECPCDGAQFLLVSGEPSTISQYPLKNYTVYYDEYSQSLHIVN